VNVDVGRLGTRVVMVIAWLVLEALIRYVLVEKKEIAYLHQES
jgi:hypothetical protein